MTVSWPLYSAGQLIAAARVSESEDCCWKGQL